MKVFTLLVPFFFFVNTTKALQGGDQEFLNSRIQKKQKKT